MARRVDLAASDFGDDGFLRHPDGESIAFDEILITDGDGLTHTITGFDYVEHLFSAPVICACGDQLDPHQVGMHTKKRRFICVPARCCGKFRWFKGEAE